jgi:hypothetical protein
VAYFPPCAYKVPNLNKAEELSEIYWKSCSLIFQMHVLNKRYTLNVLIFQIGSFHVSKKKEFFLCQSFYGHGFLKKTMHIGTVGSRDVP